MEWTRGVEDGQRGRREAWRARHDGALLGRVDAALYRAKHAGRDRVCVDGEVPEEPFTVEDQASETSGAAVPAIPLGG